MAGYRNAARMKTPQEAEEFNRNVFINCPFDVEYKALLHPLVFTILCLGLKPRLALERSNGGETRLHKIVELIESARFGIHDLSRCVAEKAGDLYRLNMPLELGIDYACRRFQPGMEKKCILILEAKKHQTKAALSDLAGCDTECHNSHPDTLVKVVRDWMVQECGCADQPAAVIHAAFLDFMADTDKQLCKAGWRRDHIDQIQLPELMKKMTSWIESNFKKTTPFKRKPSKSRARRKGRT